MMSRRKEHHSDLDESPQISSSNIIEPPPWTSIVPATASQSTPFPVSKSALGRDDNTPSLPPQMASVRSHTADEILQMMNQTPLFMTSLDNAGKGV